MRTTIAGFAGLVATASAFAPSSSFVPGLRPAMEAVSVRAVRAHGPTMEAVVRMHKKTVRENSAGA
jgi:hypothetical protein